VQKPFDHGRLMLAMGIIGGGKVGYRGGRRMRLKDLFSFSQHCSLLSGSLALEALLIGLHCKKRYLVYIYIYNIIQYKSIVL